MPQMAPMYWLYLFAFFITVLMLFLMMNYFIKPFNHMKHDASSLPTQFKHWKL
uniref:ATP synthase F0 subunit 8 n=1 Tax=Xenophthalmus pinnotheroides TaxID=585961 RepID=UPI0020292E19|nr:ATP synthase F0 subunit 8 [Xenophthalmus pinnotheroides]UPL64989.1 ATP synthase F0 subunit 8 [Xenophthalmus pinnotheroides]